MLLNYFKTAWRNIIRGKLYSLIKIMGLGISLTICLLILLYSKDELSYDRFHANGSRIYRVIQTWQIDAEEHIIGTTNGIIGETFSKEIPGVENYVRVNGRTVTVKKDDDVFTEDPLCVDDSFFSVFSFDIIAGDRETMLKDMYAVVLSEDMAKKYFGTTDVIGREMLIKLADAFETFHVTGVMANMPANSTIKTGILLTMQYNQKYNNNTEWVGGSLNTFLVMAPGADTGVVLSAMQRIFDTHSGDVLQKASEQQGRSFLITLGLQPLNDIHLSKGPGPDNGMVDGSSPVYSYILAGIAVFILVVACINFINLTIAQSLRRAKEIGVRKVVGGSRVQLIFQFLAESFTISVIAFIIAIVLTQISLPFFNVFANKKLAMSYLSDGYLYAGFASLLAVTALLAGFYPAIVLSAFRPVKVLYNRQKMIGGNLLTKGLVVCQFSLAILLIIGTLAINSQLDFLLNVDLGYNSRNLVRLDIPVSSASDPLPEIFRNELSGKPGIVSVGAKNGGRSITNVRADDRTITIEKARIDEAFIPTFGITIIAGRNFQPGNKADSLYSVIVNESLLKTAGWEPVEAIGRQLKYPDESRTPLTIVGVVKDYHFASLREKIGPAIFVMEPAFNFGNIWVRIEPTDVPRTLQLLQATFKKILPYFPYNYESIDAMNARVYDAELKWRRIIGMASVLFIFISCIGLVGLVMLSIEQRTKEIGIRKVLGAAITSIVGMITRQFVPLVVIAFLIAVPIGYYAIGKWLQNFPYRVDPEWWIYGIAGTAVIATAWIITSIQAIRAGRQNPVKSLRSE